MRTVLFLSLSVCLTGLMAAEVNIYSSRKQALIEPLLDLFTERTGIGVNMVTGEADTLVKRLETEGRRSPADILIMTDAARLYKAAELQLFQAVDSDILQSAIPAQYRDDDNYWFGTALRSRVMVYAPERVDPRALSDYLSLRDPGWRKRICVRSSSNVYNQSLVSGLIAHHGQRKIELWARGLVENFARFPAGGDRDQIRAVASGQCDLALVNNYYLAGMLDSNRQQDLEAAQAVRLFWPDQDGKGAHVNISGAGVTRHAQNRANAIKLLEFFVSDAAQRWYATENYEYPVKQGIDIGDILSRWGRFNADKVPLKQLGRLNKQAVLLMDRAGWR